jgi:hypothetical protein
VGHNSLRENCSGSYNIAIGFASLQNLNGGFTGWNNVAIGCGAGYGLTSGCNNTLLGHCANASTATSCNEVTIGNSSVTAIRAQVTTITSLSDLRDKKDIETIPVGLNFINQLHPVKFLWNMRDGGKIDVPDTGFIAQEVQQVEESFNVKEWLQLVYDKNPDKLELSINRILPIIVKAIQELSDKIDDINNKL